MEDYDLVAALEHIGIANDCGTDLVLDNEEVVALKKHLDSIRAEALKDAADRAKEDQVDQPNVSMTKEN
jgi:hypothetical protein